MVAFSISVETATGLTWPLWKRLVAEMERLNFVGVFRSDHLANPFPPDAMTLDMIVSLTYLADHTQRVHFGPLVAPLSFRDPVMLAHQAAALDALSGGRMILGLGTGWAEREHHMFGYTLGDVATRAARLEEGLEVITQLFRSQEPVTYHGQFYQLDEARLLTRPSQPQRPPILIGGNGPKRTLPLVARYADIWNAINLTPAEYAERSARLDTLVRAAGRTPEAVKRTILLFPIWGRDTTELERRVRVWRQAPPFAAVPLDVLLGQLQSFGAFVSTPDELIARLQAYVEIGVQEIIVQWWDPEDLDGLRLLAEEIVPYV